MGTLRPPFPESVRRTRPRRRRRPALPGVLLLLLAVLLLLPRWSVRSVQMGGSPPAALGANLASLKGEPLFWLDLDWVRRQVESWPGLESVEVRRELDGTLRVRWTQCHVAGTLRTGSGWHALCTSGTPGPRLAEPVVPIVEAPTGDAVTLHAILGAVRRLEERGAGRVERVRLVLPGEIEAWSTVDGRTVRVLATVTGSASEKVLPRFLASNRKATFLDLTLDDRLVVGSEGRVGS